MSSSIKTPASTNEGAASAKSSQSNKYKEWVVRKKEKESKLLAEVNTKLKHLNRPLMTMKVHRKPCSFKGKKRPGYVSDLIRVVCLCWFVVLT